MRVLDIDLDFFLADCCPLAELGHRPSLPGHEPWEASAVRAFLENQCGLSRTAPKPGRIFETHDQALTFWEEQIAAGRLTAPFDATVEAVSAQAGAQLAEGTLLITLVRPDQDSTQ